jgi:hypothetical protein
MYAQSYRIIAECNMTSQKIKRFLLSRKQLRQGACKKQGVSENGASFFQESGGEERDSMMVYDAYRLIFLALTYKAIIPNELRNLSAVF